MSIVQKNATLAKRGVFCYYWIIKLRKIKRDFLTEDPKKPENEGKKQVTFMKAFGFAAEFGFIIALPLIGLGLLGKWMDAKYGTKYWVLVGILLAIFSSTLWISKRIKDIMKDLPK